MLIDQHCHSVLAPGGQEPGDGVLDGAALGDGALDDGVFASLLTESDRPPAPGCSPFGSALGLAVRRWCPPALGLPAHTEPAEYLARRRELGTPEAGRRLLAAAGLTACLVDTGLTEAAGRPLLPLDALARLSGARTYEVVRLESVAARVRATPGRWPEALAEELAAACAGAGVVAVKSVLAYRHGLAIDPRPPGRAEVVRAAERWAAQQRAAGRREGGPAARLTDPVLLRHLLWQAVGLGLPIQLHTGFGDPDLRLHLADPALLVDFVRAVEPTGVPLVLLHCYPYHRQAAWLAHCFPHVHLDVGLTLSYTGARAAEVLGEVLELAPFGKVLFSTDAYGLPELFLVGAAQYRHALGSLLAGWQRDGACTAADAAGIEAQLSAGNAARLYGLDTDISADTETT
ncbi:amidohydrolase family protein [Kitasatospora sp. MBT63]|uniref:amidohydrolase family protein n=1 Tax=Kitasatospora sp. MBT63 TaxID=1444768 RepID=UPI0009E6BC91|nr:amidohydrolase family protein [Kitasatospora sp. MBT63]